MKSFNWITKGQTLLWLKNYVKLSHVPDLFVFNHKRWKIESEIILELIKKKFASKKIAVRSSSFNEDSIISSNAGAFQSFLNINIKNKNNLKKKIDLVFKSYNNLNIENDEVIIQEMVDNISISGVVFTHELKNMAPYYSINYDDVSGSSTTVTSGTSKYSNKALYVHRKFTSSLRSERFTKLLKSVLELEKIFKNKELDIEFIIDLNFNIKILQVRPIVKNNKLHKSEYKTISRTILYLRKKLVKRFFIEKGNSETLPIFGQMPDWNPAEIIGVVPKNLAYSLYEKLITNNIWCSARQEMNYRKPSSKILMYNFCGHPYIDVKASFSSFIPKGLDNSIAEKLIKYWLNKLKLYPEYHDKIEFNIAITSFSFQLEREIASLPKELFSAREKKKIERAYLHHFNFIINENCIGSLKKSIMEMETLDKEIKKLGSINSVKLSSLINLCIKYGTMPFAKLARHAFIGTKLIKSLHETKLLTPSSYNSFLSSFETIVSEMIIDIKKLKKSSFSKKYGHLRPGTYDITSKSYNEINPIDLFGSRSVKNMSNNFKLKKTEVKKINSYLTGLDIGFKHANEIFEYARLAIQSREKSKFKFTRVIDMIFKKIKILAKKYSISIEDISYLNINQLIAIEKNPSKYKKKKILEVIDKNSVKHNIFTTIKLPQLIIDANHSVIIPFQVSSPNFVTNKTIEGEIKYIKSFEASKNVDGKIILIESADPGYDWLFTTNFLGLITKYGGVNSHMSIRCAELQVPAAIGCGDQIFESLKKSNKVRMICASSSLQIN